MFNSPECIEWMEDITGIQGLCKDPFLLGGGIHEIRKGGHLGIHVDFNIHPELKKHRRVNALLYLNKDWKPEYQGALELWNKNLDQCSASIAPIFNRLIVFRITDDAFHGHPKPWNCDIPRYSYAFYYYTDDRPEHEKGPFHWSNFYRTRSNESPRKVL